MAVQIPVPRAFDFLFQPSRYKCSYSGRGAAKSHSYASALLVQSALKPLRILCCREVQASIRDSVKRLLDDKIKTHGLGSIYESTDAEIRGTNGALFIFAGLRNNIDNIKSIEAVDIAWVEEAQTVSQSSLDVLEPTIRKPGSELWFSWNPRFETDPVEVFRGDKCPPGAIVREIQVEDNPWFPEVLRTKMLWDMYRDPDKYDHIWRGGYLKHSEARVFKNWRVGEEWEFDTPKDTIFYFGGDWGFANDPSVLIRSWIRGRQLLIDYEAGAVGCDIDYTPFLFGGTEDEKLIDLNKQAWESPGCAQWRACEGIPGSRDWPIIADSARPETISYMQRHGFPRTEPAKKGQGSIEEGVEFLKSYDIVIHPRCKNTIQEFTRYSYKTDKHTGLILPLLEDKFNHYIDSCRYAHEGHIRPRSSAKDGIVVGTPRNADFNLWTIPGQF